MLAGTAGALALGGAAKAQALATDVTFLFSNDIHACLAVKGLSPNCRQEGKTDENLLRHIRALNRITEQSWPETIGASRSGLAGAGTPIATPHGLVIGGDMTDDGGGQTAEPEEGAQLLQFSHRYQQGSGSDRIHYPVYTGLGNHDLDQDGPAPQRDWYRRELRDYVSISHRPSVFFRPPVPATSYDVASDAYSWDWGRLHLVQLHRFGGDTRKGAISNLPWLGRDLADNAGDGRPVILFQHYGWDAFSVESWDPARMTFDDEGGGEPHWWSVEERQQLLDAIAGFNIVGLFHGHQHETAMIYRRGNIDLFKPKAAYMGGFAVVHVTDRFMDVVLGEADADGTSRFTSAFSKPVAA